MEIDTSYKLTSMGLSPALKVDSSVVVRPTDSFKEPTALLVCIGSPENKSSFLLPNGDFHPERKLGIMTNPQRGGLYKSTTHIWIKICIDYQDMAGNHYSTEQTYVSHSPADSKLIQVPGSSFTYKAIDGWSLEKADAK